MPAAIVLASQAGRVADFAEGGLPAIDAAGVLQPGGELGLAGGGQSLNARQVELASEHIPFIDGLPALSCSSS